MNERGWRRRDVLGAAVGAAVAPRLSWGFGPTTRVDIAELDLGPGTLQRPNAWKRLLHETTNTTSVECETRAVKVTPEDPELFEHPFCVLVGDDAFAEVSERGVEQLTQFLAYGGFLFIDDTTGDVHDRFDGAVRKLVERIFPTRPLAPLPGDHSALRSFFLLRKCVGRIDEHAYVEGITVGTLSPLVYCRNDVSGALNKLDSGQDVNACVPGGEPQRREAVKLGINLLMYSLTANYKNDQAHVRQLMLERRLK
jgi:hypothetical protein